MFLKFAQGIEAAGELLLRVGCAAILGSPAVTLLEDPPKFKDSSPPKADHVADAH